MALVFAAVGGLVIRVTLADEAGNKVTKDYPVDPTVIDPTDPNVTFGDIAAVQTDLVSKLNAVTDGQVVTVHWSITQIENTSFYGAAGSEIENLASLSLRLETDGKFANLQIPAPNIGIFQGTFGSDKNKVDKADVALLDFVNLFASGNGFTISDGEFINASEPIFSGKRIHRRSSRG
jgi:hypothetical protein